MRQNVVWSLIENLYSIIRRNACVIVRTWSCAVSVRDIVSKKWDGAIQLNAEAHRMILSTRDLDFEKIHKGIFTHDKAKNKWIKKRLENPTLDYPGIYSSTLYSSGVFNASGYMYTQHYGIRGVCTCSETKHNPNPLRQRKGYSTVSYVGFMAMTMRNTIEFKPMTHWPWVPSATNWATAAPSVLNQ